MQKGKWIVRGSRRAMRNRTKSAMVRTTPLTMTNGWPPLNPLPAPLITKFMNGLAILL